MLTQKIQPASWLPGARHPFLTDAWGYRELVGIIAELSAHGASATVTVAMRLVREAQLLGETTAWVTGRERCFFPPDAALNGVDLAALAVVRVPEADGLGKAADYLVRSGAFGLVVIDLADGGRLTDRHLTRLLGLARRHGTAVVCLTSKPDAAPSLGTVVSLRAPVRRERRQPGEFFCELTVLKDKRRPPGWRHGEVVRAPAGLR